MPKRKRSSDSSNASVEHKKSTNDYSFWTHLGSGHFNDVYVHHEKDRQLLEGSDYKGPWVYKKKQKEVGDSTEEKMNSPRRNVRLFKEINPDRPSGLFRNGWVAPFFKGQNPSDEQLVIGILDVYRRTRRIVMDAFSNNFVVEDGQAKCIDVDMALRRNSIDSINYWDDDGIKSYELYWDDCKEIYPLSVAIVRNLVYLEQQIVAKHIHDHHITENIISALTYYRERNLKIHTGLLESFAYLDKQGDSIQEMIIDPLIEDEPEIELKHESGHGFDPVSIKVDEDATDTPMDIFPVESPAKTSSELDHYDEVHYMTNPCAIS
jgi:hypothetical protein